MLPTDIAYVRISATRLHTPLNLEPPENDPETEEFVLDEIVKLVEAAKGDVIIMVDACSVRHGVKHEVEELYKRTGLPVYSAPMGKTAVDETYSRYGGVSPFNVVQKCPCMLTRFPDLRRLNIARGNQGES